MPYTGQRCLRLRLAALGAAEKGKSPFRERPYAPLPRLRSTYHGLPLPQVLEAAQVQRRLRCRPYLSGHRDIPCLNLRKIWPVVKF